MFTKILVPFFLLTLSFSSCPPRQAVANVPEPKPAIKTSITRPKNIIFMVGDGMGITQVTAGLYSNDNHLELERCPITGFHKSYSSNYLTTDSSAGATAFACGKKSYNGAIAVDDDKDPMPTILEEAEKYGWATGLVVTSTIAHATPACFIAHVESRKQYEDIATFFPESGIDLFIGGGSKYFNARKDQRNIIQEMKDLGYVIKDMKEESIDEVVMDPSKPFGFFTSKKDPKTYRQGRRYLPMAAKRAVTFLDERSDKGFFMMIEGSQIDWGGHSRDGKYIIEEMLDFDRTIGNVLDWAEKDGETLVVITADHETGGFAILPSSKMNKLKTKFATDYHTPVLIPVFAFGPGSEKFSGIYENTDIYQKMVAAFGW